MAISSSDPTASIIIIGNEILSGQTEDANLHFLSQQLRELDILLKEVRIVPDLREAIISAINACRQQYTYVFTTGGIGPTHDDITADSVAGCFNVPLVCNLEASSRLFEHYSEREALHARMKMSEVPHGSNLIANPVSKAPGFRMGNVFVMAGVPRIMQAMFENIKPFLKQGRKRHVRSIFCRTAEGMIAQDLAGLQKRYPEIEIGSYPRWIQAKDHGVRIVIKGYNEEELEELQTEVIEMFRQHGGEPDVLAD